MTMTPDTPSPQKRRLAHHAGEVFREARRALQMTQADVAERVGVVTEVYGRMERGHLMPSPPKLRKLCMVLRVDANAVLGLDTRETAAWLRTAAPTAEDPPALRRLLRTLRLLDEQQLAALSAMVTALVKLTGRRQPPGGEEQPVAGKLTS